MGQGYFYYNYNTLLLLDVISILIALTCGALIMSNPKCRNLILALIINLTLILTLIPRIKFVYLGFTGHGIITERRHDWAENVDVIRALFQRKHVDGVLYVGYTKCIIYFKIFTTIFTHAHALTPYKGNFLKTRKSANF